KQRLAEYGTMHFELGMRRALVALDHHQVDRRKLLQERAERRLRLVAQFVHQRPAPLRADEDLGRPGDAMAVGILARLIHIEIMVRVFERRHREPARHDARDRPREQRRLAGTTPAREADDAHGRHYSRLPAVALSVAKGITYDYAARSAGRRRAR